VSSESKDLYYGTVVEEKLEVSASKVAQLSTEKSFKMLDIVAVEKPKSPRLNNLFPDEKKDANIPNKAPSPTKVSTAKKKSVKDIRFIDFELFRNHGSIPRFPDQRKLTVPIERVDRPSSIVIFVSYSWLRKTSLGTDPPHPDNSNSDLFKLCVEGIEKTYKTLAPGHLIRLCSYIMSKWALFTEVDMKKCYLWIDYSCMNQDKDLIEEMTLLDKIVECCDCVFTPLYLNGNHSTEEQQQFHNTLSSNDSESNKSLQEDCFARELCCVSKVEATEFMNNAWCRCKVTF